VSRFSRIIRSVLVSAAIALAGMLAVSVAAASAASCLCFHAVYTGGSDLRIHDSAFNTITRTWSDQVAPASVPAKANPSAVMTVDNSYHIDYVGQDGFVHDDAQSPTTHAWTDQVPPGSVKAVGTPVALDLFPVSGSDVTFHIVYLSQTGWIHNDQFDPRTGTWFDQIPPRSVPAASSPVAEDNADYGYFRVIYVGKDGRVHEDRYNKATRVWRDSVVPGSAPAIGNPRIGEANDGPSGGAGFHIVYVGTDGFVHNDREDLSTGTWYDQIPPGSTTALGAPTYTPGVVAGFSHVIYFAPGGGVHLDTYYAPGRSWSDGIAPSSIPASNSPTGTSTYNDTFQLVYTGSDSRLHDDVFTPSTNTWSDSIPTGSAPVDGAVAVANVDN
jgi:hypothetical protein